VYQEQIMQIAQKLAGYSLGDADLMRRAMGKKKIEEMAKHENKFVDGAVERKIPRKTAKQIFDLMSKFADYGFNRSHSIAYAVLAFRTGYLKAHYPTYFYAAVLSHEADDSAKVYKYSSELKQMGLELLPPDINESGLGFTPSETAVRFGLSAIKGMGVASCEGIIAARNEGRFTSLYDFVTRVPPASVNKRGLESLIAAGAFDTLANDGEPMISWRARLTASIEPALKHGQRAAEDRASGQNDLFGGNQQTDDAVELNAAEPWSALDLSKREKAAVGLYLSTHPLESYTTH
ncbi:MAG TPA: DNA polymerase III subunit alpha, partial [Pyrinomonadaceae bacterium]|nr:DNA polymerase III subunit alpha [Pyrinomonadaceae bacterium]